MYDGRLHEPGGPDRRKRPSLPGAAQNGQRSMGTDCATQQHLIAGQGTVGTSGPLLPWAVPSVARALTSQVRGGCPAVSTIPAQDAVTLLSRSERRRTVGANLGFSLPQTRWAWHTVSCTRFNRLELASNQNRAPDRRKDSGGANNVQRS